MSPRSEQISSGEPPADLVIAAGQFFPGGAVSPIRASRRLIRVDTGSGVAVVRQWPAGTTRERVEYVHAVHATLRASGFRLVAPMRRLPDESSTILMVQGMLYDARDWLLGEPLGPIEIATPGGGPVDLPANVPHGALLAAIEAIAQFHQASVAPRRHDQRLTIRQLRGGARELWQVYRERLRPVAASLPAIQHWLRTGERALPMALSLVDQETDLAHQTAMVGHHRLWPSHVLVGRGSSGVIASSPCHFDRREKSLSPSPPGNERFLAAARNDRIETVAISGFVGLSDPAWGSPVLDLAQIGTRFARWSPELAEELIGTYSAIRQLVPGERRLLPAVATLDLVVQAAHFLDLAYGPATASVQQMASSPLVVAAESLVSSLEAVTEALAALLPRDGPSGGQGARRRRARPPVRRRAGSLQRRDQLA